MNLNTSQRIGTGTLGAAAIGAGALGAGALGAGALGAANLGAGNREQRFAAGQNRPNWNEWSQNRGDQWNQAVNNRQDFWNNWSGQRQDRLNNFQQNQDQRWNNLNNAREDRQAWRDTNAHNAASATLKTFSAALIKGEAAASRTNCLSRQIAQRGLPA